MGDEQDVSKVERASWFPETLRRLPLVAIDFEASCLPGPRSYPIEVAVVHEDGRERSWLVLPEAAWTADGFWHPKAERVHGIPPGLLLREGMPAATVAAELAAECAGLCVVSDHAQSDQGWLDMLCAAGGRGSPLVEDFGEFYYGWIFAFGGDDVDTASQVMNRLMGAARERNPQRHRAAPDARCLMDFLKAVMVEQAPTLPRPSAGY